MSDIGRRTILTAAAALAGAATPAAAASADAERTEFQPRPLPLTSPPGLSTRLIGSHYENNYVGAVRRLNAIRAAFAAQDPAQAPNFTLNGLKREELIAWNSMILHELYFSGLGTGKPAPDRPLAQAIERDFGSQAAWAREFSAMGKALGGGSGWVLLTWSPRDGKLVNQWAADHTMALAGATPILALDMYEHAYHMDYGARAGAYVDAFMQAIDWRNADALFGKAA